MYWLLVVTNGVNPRGGWNNLFGDFFQKSAWKWKKLDKEEAHVSPPPPIRSRWTEVSFSTEEYSYYW